MPKYRALFRSLKKGILSLSFLANQSRISIASKELKAKGELLKQIIIVIHCFFPRSCQCCSNIKESFKDGNSDFSADVIEFVI